MKTRLWLSLMILLILCTFLPAAWAEEEREVHDYEVITSFSPTCREAGWTAYRCKDCGAEKTETVPKLEGEGHDPGTEIIEDCDGIYQVTLCSICPKARETIEIYTNEEDKKHLWGEPQILIRGTCFKAGRTSVTCLRCGKTVEQDVPAGIMEGHRIRTENYATCFGEGQRSVCEQCEDQIDLEWHPYSKPKHLGHELVKVLEDGKALYACRACGEEYEDVAPEPTEEPTEEPTAEPTVTPTVEPTEKPTVEPTEEPTTEPTVEPTVQPTKEPAQQSALKQMNGILTEGDRPVKTQVRVRKGEDGVGSAILTVSEERESEGMALTLKLQLLKSLTEERVKPLTLENPQEKYGLTVEDVDAVRTMLREEGAIALILELDETENDTFFGGMKIRVLMNLNGEAVPVAADRIALTLRLDAEDAGENPMVLFLAEDGTRKELASVRGEGDMLETAYVGAGVYVLAAQ